MIADWISRSSATSVLALAGALALAACNTTSTASSSAEDDASEEATEVASAETEEAATPAATLDIAATVSTDPSLTILNRTLEETGLAEQLSQDGQYTLFAPNDAAFNDLPPGTVDALLLPENQGRLLQILQYHVVSSRLSSGDIAAQTELSTMEGRSISVDGSNGVHLNSATVIMPDVDATNGVIHVIDEVLIP